MASRPAVLLSLFLALYLLPAAAPAAPLFRDALAGSGPMSLDGVDPGAAAVLRKYYEASFGGAGNWAKVQDIRFEGVLELPEGEFPFFGYLKKPDFSKVILYGEGTAQVTMAYDGADAWQIVPPARAATGMPAPVAADFVRDAPVGGLLLYPSLPGKRIEALGERKVGKFRCRDLRVTLPTGQQVTYAIDLETGLERQKTSTSAASGKVETLTHNRWEAYRGVVVLAESTMTVDGEAVFTSRIQHVEVNAGLEPGMFERPPDLVPGATAGMLDIEGPFQMPGLHLPARPPVADDWGAPSTDPDDPFKLRQPASSAQPGPNK